MREICVPLFVLQIIAISILHLDGNLAPLYFFLFYCI